MGGKLKPVQEKVFPKWIPAEFLEVDFKVCTSWLSAHKQNKIAGSRFGSSGSLIQFVSAVVPKANENDPDATSYNLPHG